MNMDFLLRFFMSNISVSWRSKKVFFHTDVKDPCLVKLIRFKGARIVDCRQHADVVIVKYHQSCWWWSLKEISLSDLYYILSDADKYFYYLWKRKDQHHPGFNEKVFIIGRYMVVIDFFHKVFHVFFHQPHPFIDQKLFTKKIVRNYSYESIWVADQNLTQNTEHRGDGFLIKMSENTYMSIRDAICVFENETFPEQPFFPDNHHRCDWMHFFHNKNVSCMIVHQP
jgi:hypothetical protein